MGCDCHCAIERRDDLGRWRFVAPLQVGRSYDLFGALAGVGGTGRTPIAPPRGLPADLDPGSYADEDEDDPGDPEDRGGADEFGCHSRSWLTLAELRWHDWAGLLRDEDIQGKRREACARFVEWLQLQETPEDDLRIVFGFDS